MNLNPRALSVYALCDIEKEGRFSEKSAAEMNNKLEGADRALANDLVYGVLRNKLYLDFLINSFSKIKTKKLNPYVLQILRTGIYQIVKADRIPDFAVCDESVKLAEKKAYRAKGFVNGILREAARNKDNLPIPKGNDIEVMSVKYSCPLWLTERLMNQFGADLCEKILDDSLKPHGTYVRVNSLKYDKAAATDILLKEGVRTVDTGEKDCLKVEGAININKSSLYKEGGYSLQNINSQRAVLALNPQEGETVMDLCAAPGGKTAYIAELMKNTGRVIAFDVYEHKIKLIENTAKRLGINIIEAKCNDSRIFCEEFKGIADRVLADVPCSGIGVIHKKPDIKYNRKSEDIDSLVKIQKDILENAAKYVKVGGIIVYSTCTIISGENEMQTNEFIKRHPEFEKEEEWLYFPHETDGSGFYVCRLRKIGEGI